MKTPHVKYLIPITYHSKTIAKVKVFEKYRRSNFKVKVTRSKVKVSNENSHHKESTCEI